MPSEDSSPDEKCRCGHSRSAHRRHDSGRFRTACGVRLFEPRFADNGMCECVEFVPVEPGPNGPHCIRENGCRHLLTQECLHGCAEAADELTRLGQEMEAQPPHRPPYAVAYATEDGSQYEVALPGDATVRAHEGALIITHTSPVKGLTQARPMEGA